MLFFHVSAMTLVRREAGMHHSIVGNTFETHEGQKYKIMRKLG
jgi:hypothetical protein